MDDVIDQMAIKKHYIRELFFNRIHKSSNHEYHPVNGAKFNGGSHRIYARINVYNEFIGENLVGIWVMLVIDIYNIDPCGDTQSADSESYTVEVSDPNGIDFFFEKIEALLLKYKMNIPYVTYTNCYYIYGNSATNSTSSTTSNYIYA